MGPFDKYVICIMAFFIPFTCVTLCQFYSITSSLSFKKNKPWNERKEEPKNIKKIALKLVADK